MHHLKMLVLYVLPEMLVLYVCLASSSGRLKEEKRRLLQEKAENEQMLQLLETQRDVLSKNVNRCSVNAHILK